MNVQSICKNCVWINMQELYMTVKGTWYYYNWFKKLKIEATIKFKKTNLMFHLSTQQHFSHLNSACHQFLQHLLLPSCSGFVCFLTISLFLNQKDFYLDRKPGPSSIKPTNLGDKTTKKWCSNVPWNQVLIHLKMILGEKEMPNLVFLKHWELYKLAGTHHSLHEYSAKTVKKRFEL